MFVVNFNNLIMMRLNTETQKTKVTKSLENLYPCNVVTANYWGTINQGNGLFTSRISANLKLITISNRYVSYDKYAEDDATVVLLRGLR